MSADLRWVPPAVAYRRTGGKRRAGPVILCAAGSFATGIGLPIGCDYLTMGPTGLGKQTVSAGST